MKMPGSGSPTPQLSAQKKIQAVLGIVAGKGLCGFGRWDDSREMFLAEGRTDLAQKHEEKAEGWT